MNLYVTIPSKTTRIGYGLFIATGQRISSLHVLSVSHVSSCPLYTLIPVTLKPVNACGTPLQTTYADDAILSPYCSAVLSIGRGPPVLPGAGSEQGPLQHGRQCTYVKVGEHPLPF
ncbi:MAG: hypothetical protein M1493_05000 [Firmicutes bacterium]|nr:hypothetical protein [Bacillota bacterium]